jgi:hypothetical protein
LRSAIEGLYQAFSRYPLRGHIDASPSVSGAAQALLYSKNLRDLGPDEIAQYLLDALTMWGWTDDFRHFLPRIFELSSSHGGRWTIPEDVFGKLPYGQWETWPPEERQVITSFFEALWSNVLDHYDHAFSAAECLNATSTRCGLSAITPLALILQRGRYVGSFAGSPMKDRWILFTGGN